LLTVSLGLLAAVASCGSDDDKKKARTQRPGEAGESSGAGAGESNAGGAGAVGMPGGGTSGSGGQGGGAAGMTDAEAGAGGEATVGDAGGAGGVATVGDTGGEGGAAGEGGVAGEGGEPQALNVVFATFGSSLVRIDPDTADVTVVNTLRSTDGLTTYSEASIAYGGVPGQALIVTPRYDATADLPPPALGALDLCTGIVTDLVELTRDTGGIVRAIEGITRAPSGVWYVSTGDLAGPQASVTNRIGTLDVATRVVSNLSATVNTAQDDMDAIDFVGDVLYGVDLATNTTSLELVTISLADGLVAIQASPVFAAGATPLRFAYDASRSKAFSWRLSDRNLVELSLTTGQATAIGETHSAEELGASIINGMAFAPPPACN
jgi:hypothetical protein